MSANKTDIPYGTLDLLVLKTLDSMGPLNGYQVARRIERISENILELNQGSIYPALLRLEQKGWIASKWGVSATNRKVKTYALTTHGRKQLETEVQKWSKTTALVTRFLEATS